MAVDLDMKIARVCCTLDPVVLLNLRNQSLRSHLEWVRDYGGNR